MTPIDADRDRENREPPGGCGDVSGKLRVGCSGWVYRDWRGVVYPDDLPARQWFDFYSAMFDTVEINNTFYRLPPESTVDKWREQASEGFCYAVKVGQFGSHRMKLKDPAGWVHRHLERAERLGPHLGPNLVQLPPRWRKNAERLDEFLATATEMGPAVRWTVEMREPSWLADDVLDVLARHRAALCLHDMLPDHPWPLTTSWTYVRFHGPDAVNAKYQGRYGPERLAPVADRLAAWLDSGVDVYAYFNNDWHGNAPADARDLRHLVDHRLGLTGSSPGASERSPPLHRGDGS
jgi:uncharacterized protein YecE (DUF72 family)